MGLQELGPAIGHHGELTMQTRNLRTRNDWAALATMALCSCFGTESRPRKGVRLAPVIAIDEDTADCQPIFHERNVEHDLFRLTTGADACARDSALYTAFKFAEIG